MIDTAIQRIVDQIAIAVTNVKTVQVHGGIYDPEELARAAVYAPSLLLAVTDIGPAQPAVGGTEHDVALRLHIITSGYDGKGKDIEALNLVGRLFSIIIDHHWGDPETWKEQTQLPSAANLYSANLNSMSIALWAIDWQQKLFISRN